MQKITTALFIIIQVVCALVAFEAQSTALMVASTTQGVSVSMFIAAALFGLINAILTYRIWYPARKRVARISLTDSESEARVGFILYIASFIIYGIVAGMCLFKRLFIEHVPLIHHGDWIIFLTVAAILLIILYVCKTLEIKEPLADPYVSGVIAAFVIGIPQLGSAITILRHSSDGVSEIALLAALVMVVAKLLYYILIFVYSEDRYKKSKATGVLIAETGNLLTWAFVLAAYYKVA